MTQTDPSSTVQTALPGAVAGPQVKLENYDTITQSSRYRDEHSDPPSPELPVWDYRIERDRETDNIAGILARSPDGGIQVRLSDLDTLYRRTVRRREDEQLVIEWRLFLVGPIYYRRGTLMIDLLHCPSPVRYSREEIRNRDLDHRQGDWAEAMPAATLVESLAVDGGRWNHSPPAEFSPDSYECGDTIWVTHEPIAPNSDREPVASVSELDFEVLTGEGALTTLNSFLEGGEDGLVEHRLGGVTGLKAGFVARHMETNEIVSAAVLETHPNPDVAARGDTLYLSRLASHPTRPPNTSSWMLSRLRDWVAERGYEKLVATAGVGDNLGTCYAAAGFELDEGRTGWADGGGWTNREGRTERRDGQKWYRRRWVCDINKAK